MSSTISFSSPTSLVPIGVMLKPDFSPAQTQNNSDHAQASLKDSPHAFHSRKLFTFFVSHGIFNLAGRLIKDLQACKIPASSIKQKEKFETLLADPGPIYDHSNQVVLPSIDGFELVGLLSGTNIQRESKFIVTQRLAGGGAAVVMESDLAWRQTCIKEILDEDDYKNAVVHLKEGIERNLPDIDIHLICKPGTECLREAAAHEFVDALAARVLKDNPGYIDNQIEVLTKTLSEQKNLEEHDIRLLGKLNDYKKDKSNNAPSRVLSRHHFKLAGLIIRRNCFKKFSVNSFGTIIAIGKLELVITEKPDHLTIPDLFAYNFEADYKRKKITSLDIAHQTQECKEAVLCRILKIAGLNGAANEHMLLKLCSFESQGYWIPNPIDMDKACEAFVNFVYSAQTRKLTEAGITHLERYKSNHFVSNPEEGICALFRLYQQLEKSKHGRLIQLIASVMREVKGDEKTENLLKIVQNMITNYPHEHSQLIALLKVFACIHLDLGESLESEDPQSHENLILFPSKAYVLKVASTVENAFANLQAYALSGMCSAFLQQAYDNIPPRKCTPLLPETISKSIVYNAMDWVQNKHPGVARLGLYLLLRCPEPEAVKFLCLHLPECLKLEKQGQPRKRLFSLYKESFALDGLEGCLNKFQQRFAFEENESEDYLPAWMEILAEDHLWAEEAYKLWENLHSQNKMPDSAGFAHRMLPAGMPWALKIISRTVCRDNPAPSPSVDALQDRLMTRLLQLFEMKFPPLSGELLATIQPVTVWLIKNLCKVNKDNALKLCQSAPPSVRIWNCLLKSDFNYWPLCDGQRALDQLEDLEKMECWGRMMDGIVYVFSLPGPIPWRIQALARLSSALPHIFAEKADSLTFQNRLKLMADAFEASKTDDDAVQKVRLPLLQTALKECHHLQRTSTNLSFEHRLKELTGLLFLNPERLKFTDGLDPQAFAELLIGLANDPQKILAPYAEQLRLIIPSLVKALKTLKRYNAVQELFSSLRAAGILIEEGEEAHEAFCIALIQELSRSQNPDEKIPQLFAKLRLLPASSPAWPHLLVLFQAILAKSPPASSELFLKNLNGLPAVPPTLPYSEVLLKEIQKNENAGRTELVFKLLKLAQDHNLTSPKKENFDSSAKNLVKKFTAAGSTPKDLENAAALLKRYPALGIEMLPDVTKTASEIPHRNVCASIYDLWGIVLKGSQPEVWTPEQYRENCLNYIKALKISSSPLLVGLLRSQTKIFRHFNAPAQKAKKLEICGIWLEGCFDQVKDLNKLTNSLPDQSNTSTKAIDAAGQPSETSQADVSDDYQALVSLWQAYAEEAQVDENRLEKFYYMSQWISLHACSSGNEYIFKAWHLINVCLKARDEKSLMPLVPVIVKTLDRTSALTSTNFRENQFAILETASQLCRSKLASCLQPSSWIAALSVMDGDRQHTEALEWLDLYIIAKSGAKKPSPYKPIPAKMINRCLSKALLSPTDPTERICDLIERALIEISNNGSKKEFDAVLFWTKWLEIKINLCLEIQDAYVSCNKLYETFLTYMHKSSAKGINEIIAGDKFMEKLAALIPAAKYDLLCMLWNAFLKAAFHDEPSKLFLKKEYQTRLLSPFLFLLLDAATIKNCYNEVYYNICKIFYKILAQAILENQYTVEQKALTLDLCYNLATQMIWSKHRAPKRLEDIKYLFYTFRNLATPKDEELYVKHLYCVAMLLNAMLENWLGLEDELVFYKSFVLGGCPDGIISYFSQPGHSINQEILVEALESLMQEKWNYALSVKTNMLPQFAFFTCVEKNLFKSYSHFIKLVDLTKTVPSGSDKDQVYCFNHTPAFKLAVQRLLKNEPYPFGCGYNFFRKIIDRTLNLYDVEENEMAFEGKTDFLITIFNWVPHYAELAFDTSSIGFQRYYNVIVGEFFRRMCSLCENKNFSEIKLVFERFFPLLITPRFENISQEGHHTRAVNVLQCIRLLTAKKELAFQVMARTLFKMASEKEIFEGCSDILANAKSALKLK